MGGGVNTFWPSSPEESRREESMRGKQLVTVFLGLLLALGGTIRAQDSTPESKGAAKGTAGSASQQPASGEAAPSPDEIIEQMGGQQPAASSPGNVEDSTTSPALLEEGNFEAGRDIFRGIFDTTPEAGPMLDGLPGMRVEEVS